MVRLFWVLVVIYVIGIGVELTPTVRASWDTVPASQLTGRVFSELPGAAAWPKRVYDVVRAQFPSSSSTTPVTSPAPAPAAPAQPAPAPAPAAPGTPAPAPATPGTPAPTDNKTTY